MLFCLVASLVFTPLHAAPAFPLTVEDAQHHKIVIKQRPRRIISLAPNVTESLFAIGAGDRVIADTTYCRYPQKALTLPKVGGYIDPNTEKVVGMAPDLVIAARGTREDILDHMRAIGLTLFCVDCSNLNGVTVSLKQIGRIVGASDAANRLAASLDARQEAVRKTAARLPAAQRPATLFLFSLNDTFSAGPGSHIDDFIQLAGGRNVAARTRLPWPQLSMEAIVAANPQVILVLNAKSMGERKNILTTQKALAVLRGKAQWRNLDAVKHGRVVVLDDDSMTIPGPRLIEGLEATARALHPELFPAGRRR